MENYKNTEISPEFTEEERRKIFEFCVLSAFGDADSLPVNFENDFYGRKFSVGSGGAGLLDIRK